LTGDADAKPVRKVSFHKLRHGHATRLMEAGVSPKVVAERLGHTDVAFTLRVYSHVAPGVQRAAIDAFERTLAGQADEVRAVVTP
jgi:integrase